MYAHPTFSSYEPELFPGLIYRLGQPRVVLLIFVSGKVVITGAKKEEDLVEGLRKVYPVMLEFRKVNVGSIPGSGEEDGVALAAAGGSTVPVPALPPIVAAGNVASLGKGVRKGKGKGAPRVRRGKDLQQDGNLDV